METVGDGDNATDVLVVMTDDFVDVIVPKKGVFVYGYRERLMEPDFPVTYAADAMKNLEPDGENAPDGYEEVFVHATIADAYDGLGNVFDLPHVVDDEGANE